MSLHPDDHCTPNAYYAQHFLARSLAAVEDHDAARLIAAQLEN